MRAVFRLQWDKSRGEWALYRTSSQGNQLIRRYPGLTKVHAEQRAARYVKGLAPSQLVIRNKSGKIARENTYLSDPRRYVG